MSGTNDKKSKHRPGPTRFVASTDALPAHLDDRARKKMFVEQLEDTVGIFDLTWSEDLPFECHNIITDYDGIQLLESRATITRAVRSPEEIAKDGSEDFLLHVNLGSRPTQIQQQGRELELDEGLFSITSRAETGLGNFHPLVNTWTVYVPRALLSELVQEPDDLVLRTMDPNTQEARFLRDYLTFLFRQSSPPSTPVLAAHVSRSVVDLLALALGASRDGAELAKMHGSRAAQLQLILAGIEAEFDKPTFSAQALAMQLGLSQRSIQDILSKTGRSFSNRVLELRLQRARKILSSPQSRRMTVSDIAAASGFSDIPHFNRSFRRRFGASPTQYRK